jgi:hypothetical protein
MEVKMVKTETRDLSMHPKLLMDTIKRQAGTLQKANLEGVMNAIEAGSPVVRIELVVKDGKARLSIGDDGIGIETKEELIHHFETFGTPHDESENTYWKQFRMGRGQMFAFGKNVWRTATFQMEVDIENKGLTYNLIENLPFVKGCQIDIDLYKNPVGYSHNSIESYKEMITEQVKFMEGKILFNGEQINTPASTCNWDFQDENAYYLFNIGTDFIVYNLGAFVMKPTDLGMVGIAVSKKQVKVNFARNDIQHDCPVYNGYTNDDGEEIEGIVDVVRKNRIKKTRKSQNRLTSRERIATLKDLRDGEQTLKSVSKMSLIPTAQGKHISLDVIRKIREPWCFAPLGDRFADRLMERGEAICLSESLLTDMGYTGCKKNFFTWLVTLEADSINYEWSQERFLEPWETLSDIYVPFKKLTEGISDTYQNVPYKKYTATERRIINVLQNQDCWNGRQLRLGYSDTAAGWTDGSTYICIERNWLKRKSLTWGHDIAKIQMLLAHEMAHDEDSRGTHIHGPEFYENMVTILESSNSPVAYCAEFRYYMERSKIEERRSKEQQKKEKKKQKVNEKLGIAAKQK